MKKKRVCVITNGQLKPTLGSNALTTPKTTKNKEIMVLGKLGLSRFVKLR